MRAAPEFPDDPWDEQERGHEWSRDEWDQADRVDEAQLDQYHWDTDSGLPPLDRLDDGALTDSSVRRRANSAARPLPAIPRRDRKLVARAMRRSEGRALRPLDAQPPITALALSTASVPDLAAYRPRPMRPRVDTRVILETARKPWSVARMSLALLAMVLAIVTTYAAAGESPQPLMFSQAAVGAGPAGDIPWPVNAITAKVQPETQLMRPDLYDSVDQFNLYGGAACSAAALSEILKAYGVPNTTIGRMIDELGPDISPHDGLETYDGFVKVAALHGLRADVYVDKKLTYTQMQYLANTLGFPVIVNVRISYGYFHFFSGGHFLVMTYGDDQGLRLVDSSEYYVKYLPMDVFHTMFTGRTVVIVPKDFQYTLPA